VKYSLFLPAVGAGRPFPVNTELFNASTLTPPPSAMQVSCPRSTEHFFMYSCQPWSFPFFLVFVPQNDLIPTYVPPFFHNLPGEENLSSPDPAVYVSFSPFWTSQLPPLALSPFPALVELTRTPSYSTTTAPHPKYPKLLKVTLTLIGSCPQY